MWKSGCLTLEIYCEEKREKIQEKKKMQSIVKQEEKGLKKE